MPGQSYRCMWVMSSLLAAMPMRSSGQTWEVFDMTTAGLPSNSITDLVEDSQGMIWAGTEWGLCRYDGSDWTIYQEGTSGLPGNAVRALAIDSLDRVWIGTQLHGIVVYDGTNWSTYDADNSGLPENEINSLTIDHRGWAWVGTYLGLACYTGSEWRVYNTSDTAYNGQQLNGNTILHTAVREDGLVAVGTLNGGFHYLTDTSVTVHATYIDFFPDNTQNETAFDPGNDERWVATPSQGLLRQGGDWYDGPWFQYTTGNSAIPSNAVNCVRVDAGGQVWIGTLLAGVGVRDTNGSFTNYTSSNSGLPDNTVQCILVASDGAVWVGTAYGGVARLSFNDGSNEHAFARWDVFPNPCHGRLTLNGHGAAVHGSWELLDQEGRQALAGVVSGASRADIHLEGSAPGLYTLLLTNDKGRQAWKILLLP